MMTKRYDLHTHSTFSDGTCTPKELVDLAVNAELAGISITDHDTIDSYTEDLAQYAKEKGVEVIPGVEFSSHYGDSGIHVLGYYFDINHPKIRDFCLKHKERRKERNLQILQLLKKAGMEVFEEDLRDSIGVIGRPHIAIAMMKKNFVSSIQDAFRLFIGDGKPCFAAGKRFSLEETIAIIHEARGKAVLAHPILIKKRSLIKKVLEFPFDGVECFYGNFSAKQNAEIAHLAQKQGDLVQTGGSDFHGSVKPHSVLGSAYTTEENLERLRRARSNAETRI